MRKSFEAFTRTFNDFSRRFFSNIESAVTDIASGKTTSSKTISNALSHPSLYILAGTGAVTWLKFDIHLLRSEVKADIAEFKKEMKEDVDKRFEAVNKQFERVDKQFEKVDKQFEMVNKQLLDINNTLHYIYGNLQSTGVVRPGVQSSLFSKENDLESSNNPKL